MQRFTQIKQILDAAVGGLSFAAHGPFWRTLTRDQFVARSVFGLRLVAVGNGANSNLIKALKGLSPFGSDIGTAGAIYRRMPAGKPPVSDQDIATIKTWIDDGCPDDQPADAAFDLAAGGPIDPLLHNAYWREFDNWAMFQAGPEIEEAINSFFAVASLWMEFAKDATKEAAWANALTQTAVKDALLLLSVQQMGTVRTHYGNGAIPLLTVFDGYEKFGAGTLPEDPQRPQDPNHNMNGASMWFFWSAFADACLRGSIAPQFWKGLSRAILVGLLNDGLFRRRYPVTGFPADDAGRTAVRAHARSVTDAEMPRELARRFAASGLG